MLLSVWVTLHCRAVVYPGIGLPYWGIRLPSSSWGRVARHWAAHIGVAALPQRSPPFSVMQCQSSALGCPHCCGLPYLGVRLPLLLYGCVPRCWAALPRRSPPFAVVGLHASALGCPMGCSPPFIVVRCWAANVIVGSPSVMVTSSRRHALLNLGVGLPMSLWTALVPPFVIVWC